MRLMQLLVLRIEIVGPHALIFCLGLAFAIVFLQSLAHLSKSNLGQVVRSNYLLRNLLLGEWLLLIGRKQYIIHLLKCFDAVVE